MQPFDWLEKHKYFEKYKATSFSHYYYFREAASSKEFTIGIPKQKTSNIYWDCMLSHEHIPFKETPVWFQELYRKAEKQVIIRARLAEELR